MRRRLSGTRLPPVQQADHWCNGDARLTQVAEGAAHNAARPFVVRAASDPSTANPSIRRTTISRRNDIALAGAIFTAFAVSPPATAAEPGLYATALFGLANQSDQSLRLSGAGAPQSGNASLGTGGLAGAAVGCGFGNGWRLEGEFAYQSVDSRTTGFSAPTPTGDGNFASTSVALNLVYGLDLGGSPDATTYVGAGLVRLTEVDLDIEQGGRETSFSGSGSGFQLLFGARYTLGEQWFFDAGLRWLRAGSLGLDREGGPGGRIVADYEPWAVTVGIGRRF